jgi:hypothetical protein
MKPTTFSNGYTIQTSQHQQGRFTENAKADIRRDTQKSKMFIEKNKTLIFKTGQP